MNRIAWLVENSFHDFPKAKTSSKNFDYHILKSGLKYSKKDYIKIRDIKKEYDECIKSYQQLAKKQRLDKDEIAINRNMILLYFKSQCEIICPNENELCEIILDICYSSNKSRQFAWDICGKTIINNLLKKNDYIINYPVYSNGIGEFEFGGYFFQIHKKKLKEDDENNHIK